MPTSLPSTWPFDASPDEVETRPELDAHLALGSLAGLIIQGLDLAREVPDLGSVDLTDTLFVGCRFSGAEVAADLVRRGAHIVPRFDGVPYPTHPGRLYTPEDLSAGFSAHGFDAMYDSIVFEHFRRHGGAKPDIREALAQRLHDAGMDNALADAISSWTKLRGGASAVGVMGGHATRRGSAAYRLTAAMAHQLAGAGRLVVTGGGPGVMEAANLGAYLCGRDLAELAAAVDELAAAPDFHDHHRYTAAALAVRAAHPGQVGDRTARLAQGGLAVPTWLYGHEPANLFAAGIAKYFSNAIREDVILRLSRGGIVFAPGNAGTVQEVFQAATKAYYHTDGDSGPFVFLDRSWWAGLPAPDLLRTVLAGSPHGDLSGLVHVIDDVAEAVKLLAGG